jgi:hypothetical protein
MPKAATKQRKVQADETSAVRLSILKLATRFGLDRATVVKRLDLARIEPVEVGPKLKLYELTPRLEAVLGAIHNPLAEVKLRAATADAEYREAKVQQMRGEMVPHNDAVELTRQIVSTLHRDLVVALPKKLGPKLARTKTAAETTKLLKKETEKVFRTLREQPEGFVKT